MLHRKSQNDMTSIRLMKFHPTVWVKRTKDQQHYTPPNEISVILLVKFFSTNHDQTFRSSIGLMSQE